MLSRFNALFHRQLWQRLPSGWRRAALFAATGVLAPRPSASAVAAPPLIVAGCLRTASGLGQSGRLCCDALRLAQENVYGIDLSAAMLQPVDQPDVAFVDGRELGGAGTVILHVNSPLVPMAMLRLGRRLLEGKYMIGYWAWELPRLPSDWRHGVPFVHEIWVPSRFVAEAVQPVAAGKRLRIVPHPVACDVASTVKSVEARPFTVLTIFNMGSSFERKNPLAAIEAFKRAFGRDRSTRLILKTANVDTFPQGLGRLQSAIADHPNIMLVTRSIQQAEIDALYDTSDVLLSMHRSEGFGLVLAEAMCRGLPVVATDWSGNRDFLTEQTGVPVPCRLIAARDPQGTYDMPSMMWADPDVDAAANALRQLRDDPTLRERLGREAARTAAEHFGVAAYLRSINQALNRDRNAA